MVKGLVIHTAAAASSLLQRNTHAAYEAFSLRVMDAIARLKAERE